jgi:hypothetical protein
MKLRTRAPDTQVWTEHGLRLAWPFLELPYYRRSADFLTGGMAKVSTGGAMSCEKARLYIGTLFA